MSVLRGGPLGDDREVWVHSLVVHMRGDGRFSVGAYVRVYDEDGRPTSVFEWHPEPSSAEAPGESETEVTRLREALEELVDAGEPFVAQRRPLPPRVLNRWLAAMNDAREALEAGER